jgi:hypothetical protein
MHSPLRHQFGFIIHLKLFVMKKISIASVSLLTALLLHLQQADAQNSSPYWSLAGNSNASASSKLGTTNLVDLKLYTNNSARLTILGSNGFVGIGTTAPTSRFTVNSATSTSPVRISINGSTKLYMSSAGGLSVGSGSSAPANGLYVSGNVGIGTATPSYKLQVNGNASVSNGLYVGNNGVYGYNSGGPGVYASGSSYGTYAKSIDGPGVQTESTNNYGLLASSTNNYGIYGQGNAVGIYGSGSSSASTAYGVYGYGYTTAGGSTDIAVGVYGNAYNGSGTSRPAYGVYGLGLTGVYGYSTAGGGTAVNARATGAGAYGLVATSNQHIGVYGYTGNASSWAGYFIGRVYSSGGFTSSDKKLKQDINDLNSAMDIIGKLQPKTYTFRQDGNYKLMNMPQGTHYGLIAQDVEQLLPELVATADFNTARVRPPKPIPTPKGTPSNASGTTPDESAALQETDEVIEFKTLNYTELIPIMIKGMQEQTELIKQQQAQIDDLKAQLNRLSGNSITVTGTGSLGVNTPNPARNSTRISYAVPGNSQAQLLITDAAGRTIKAFSLNGSGRVDVNTATLSSGIYHYSLLIDGKIVESRKMEVVR